MQFVFISRSDRMIQWNNCTGTWFHRSRKWGYIYSMKNDQMFGPIIYPNKRTLHGDIWAGWTVGNSWKVLRCQRTDSVSVWDIILTHHFPENKRQGWFISNTCYFVKKPEKRAARLPAKWKRNEEVDAREHEHCGLSSPERPPSTPGNPL